MPDFKSPPPQPAETFPNLYPTAGQPATPALIRLIREKIAASRGTIPFSSYMALALYHPEHGYYAKDLSQVGREGDFFTSVSSGPLFGRILARRFISWWKDNGRPRPWRIIEAGAHDGTLAADILTEISTVEPDAIPALEYVIPEPLPRLRQAQAEKLRSWPHLRHVDSLDDLADEALPGIAFGNEVLDALPFDVIRRTGGIWRECLVGADGDNFVFVPGDPFPDGPAGDFPEGYQTEVRSCHADFLRPFRAAMKHGLLLWFDYGYDRETYYHPSRLTGTIRTFARHQAGENPFVAPGLEDITAHVDFTAAAEAAASLGFKVAPLRSQSSRLTEAARGLLLSMEGNPDASFLRQFQTLTHPGQLGARFHVMECVWQPT